MAHLLMTMSDATWDGTVPLGLELNLYQFLLSPNADLEDKLARNYGLHIAAQREEDGPFVLSGPVPGLPAVYSTLRKHTLALFQRYVDRIDALPPERMDHDGPKSFAHLRWMCVTSIEQIDDHPMDKLHRWLGFVQAGLFWKDALDVEEERNFSRPLFHEAYEEMGLRAPATRERS